MEKKSREIRKQEKIIILIQDSTQDHKLYFQLSHLCHSLPFRLLPRSVFQPSQVWEGKASYFVGQLDSVCCFLIVLVRSPLQGNDHSVTHLPKCTVLGGGTKTYLVNGESFDHQAKVISLINYFFPFLIAATILRLSRFPVAHQIFSQQFQHLLMILDQVNYYYDGCPKRRDAMLCGRKMCKSLCRIRGLKVVFILSIIG